MDSGVARGDGREGHRHRRQDGRWWSRKKSGLGALHLVTAWATESGLTLGQVACAEKSNEITAIPELLPLLNIKGCTVTIDALGCQKEIAAQITAQKGHYVLALKGNQAGLEEDMRQLLLQELEGQAPASKGRTHETNEKGHGRVEQRHRRAIDIPVSVGQEVVHFIGQWPARPMLVDVGQSVGSSFPLPMPILVSPPCFGSRPGVSRRRSLLWRVVVSK